MAKSKRKSSFAGKTTSNAKKQQNQGSNYGYLKIPKGVNLFKEEPGRTTLDIIPYEVSIPNHPDLDEQDQIALMGDLWYKLPFKVHRNIGASNETVVCPKSFGKKCPICEYREKRFKEGAEKEETDALRASMRNLYAVIVINSKGERKVQVWDISQFLFQNLLNAELEEDEDFGIFPDLEDGLSLKIRFEEKQLGKNKFSEATRIDFIDREDQYGEEILEKVPNLDEMLTIHSYEKLEKMFLELEDEVDDEEEEKPVRKRKPAPVEDEDDEPKPTRKSKPQEDPYDDEVPPARKRKPAPVEEEDDEPKPVRKRKPEPEEEEEAPKPKRGKKEADDKCPYGHKYGVDTDEHDDCETCELWDSCIEAKEAGD